MGRILVIRGGAVGDFILTLPAIRLLREGLPGNHIEILGYRPIIDLAMESGHVDAVRSIEFGPMAGFFAPGSKLDEELCAYFRSFDVILSYLYDPDGHFHGNLERAEAKTILRGIHKPVEGGGHAAGQLAGPLEKLALFLEDPAPVVRTVDPLPDEAPALPRKIAIHPGSGSKSKNWPMEKWAEVGVAIAKREGKVELVLVTGEAEAEGGELDVLLDLWREESVAFERADQMPLAQLVGILRRCLLYFGNDSGISHLAAACGCPCVLVFGPTDAETWAPRNAGVRVLEAPGGKLESVTAERVLAAAREQLEVG